MPEMYVNDPSNAELFANFCKALQEFTQDLENERTSIDKSLKRRESQDLEAEIAFSERVAEEKTKFAVQREKLEQELQKLTEQDEKLQAQKEEWEKKLNVAHEALMTQLESDNAHAADAHFGDQFASLISAMENLSSESMNGQFTMLKHNLDALNIEKQQLSVSIADQTATLESMKSALVPTCGATYEERNVMSLIFLSQVSKVRSSYQKARLQEEALKAKLSS